MNYNQKKLKIRSKVDTFVVTDNLFELADAYILIKEFLKKEDFPLAEYIKWLKKQK